MSVHDGDTLRAIDEGKVEQRIRLAGIDAPERGQPFGNVARERLAALTMGQPVEVYIEDRDRYGRTVARLKAGGVDVCRQMVADGLAWHFTRYSDDATLAAAEIEARAAGRGLWRDPEPVARGIGGRARPSGSGSRRGGRAAGWAPRLCGLGTPPASSGYPGKTAGRATPGSRLGAPAGARERGAAPAAAGYTCQPKRTLDRGKDVPTIPANGVPSGVPKTKKCVLEGKRMASGHTGNLPA